MTFAGEEHGYGLEHQCPAMPQQGVEIRRCAELGDGDTPAWVLSIYREATEDDLEQNHYLEEVGEILWNTLLAIRHCPFCGEQLPGDSDAGALSASHFDYSGWSVEER